MRVEQYDYPASGLYNETIATIGGKDYTVNTQYECVAPRGPHPHICAVYKMGGRCDCGMLNGIDVNALVTDARKNGKMGLPPRQEISKMETESAAALCPKCGTYCYGDCEGK